MKRHYLFIILAIVLSSSAYAAETTQVTFNQAELSAMSGGLFTVFRVASESECLALNNQCIDYFNDGKGDRLSNCYFIPSVSSCSCLLTEDSCQNPVATSTTTTLSGKQALGTLCNSDSACDSGFCQPSPQDCQFPGTCQVRTGGACIPTSAQSSTTTTTVEATLIPGKLELVSSKLSASKLNINDKLVIKTTWKALQEGEYVLEAYYVPTDETFSLFTKTISVNECDELAKIAQEPSFRNMKVSFSEGEFRDVNFEFPAIKTGGNYIAYVDAVKECRSAVKLVGDIKVSGFVVGSGIDRIVDGDACTKVNGDACQLKNLPSVDDSGPNDECRSGWCTDSIESLLGVEYESITSLGGRCADVGTLGTGDIDFSRQPSQVCVDRGTTSDCGAFCTFFKRLFSGASSFNLGSIVIWAVVIIGGLIALNVIMSIIKVFK